MNEIHDISDLVCLSPGFFKFCIPWLSQDIDITPLAGFQFNGFAKRLIKCPRVGVEQLSKLVVQGIICRFAAALQVLPEKVWETYTNSGMGQNKRLQSGRLSLLLINSNLSLCLHTCSKHAFTRFPSCRLLFQPWGLHLAADHAVSWRKFELKKNLKRKSPVFPVAETKFWDSKETKSSPRTSLGVAGGAMCAASQSLLERSGAALYVFLKTKSLREVSSKFSSMSSLKASLDTSDFFGRVLFNWKMCDIAEDWQWKNFSFCDAILIDVQASHSAFRSFSFFTTCFSKNSVAVKLVMMFSILKNLLLEEEVDMLTYESLNMF